MRDVAGMDKLRQHAGDLLAYLERNEVALVHYAARRRRGEPIATSFVESAVDEIISWRMNKAQQMRWSRGDGAALPCRAYGGVERHARGRLPASPSRLSGGQRRPEADSSSGSLITPKLCMLSDLTAARVDVMRAWPLGSVSI